MEYDIQCNINIIYNIMSNVTFYLIPTIYIESNKQPLPKGIVDAALVISPGAFRQLYYIPVLYIICV